MQLATARHYAQAVQWDANEARIHAEQARRHSGVCISGMAPEPFVPKTERDLIASAEASAAREAAWLESAQGKAIADAVAVRRKALLLAQYADATVSALNRQDGSAARAVERFEALLSDIKGDAGLLWCAASDADAALAAND